MFRQTVRVALTVHALTGNASLRRFHIPLLIPSNTNTKYNLQPRRTHPCGQNLELRKDE